MRRPACSSSPPRRSNGCATGTSAKQQLARLRAGGEPRRTLTIVAPAAGVIIKDPPVAGMRFMPGEALFRIADLSRVWMIGDVFEQDLALVRIGSRGTLAVSAYPDRTFPGELTFIYPTLNAETRTARVRFELANPQGQLKPGMYGTVQIDAGAKREVLAVPDSAVIDSGSRQVVLVALGEGRFEPREVKTRRARRRLRRGAVGRQGGRPGRHARQLPDRRGEQPEGGARQLHGGIGHERRRRQGGRAQRASGASTRWMRRPERSPSRTIRWPRSTGRR